MLNKLIYPTGLINLKLQMIFLHRVYLFFITPIRSSKIINFLLFGFYPRNKKYGSYWDWTSIQIRRGLKKYFDSSKSFLDVGTGPYGVLSFYVRKRLKGKIVIGCDHCEDLITNAMAQSAIIDISFIKCDLFQKIEGLFDFIVFNAPYIEKDYGIEIGVLKDDLSINRWSGGKRGTTIIERFINDLHLHLSENGICLLGVNHFYVKNEVILSIIIENKKLEIAGYSKNRLTKSAVYIIKKGIR